MSAVEKIQIAEEKVADLQGYLGTVESALERAETVIVAGEKTGRGFRRFVKMLILLGLVAVIVIIIKNVMASRSGGIDEPEFATASAETVSETDVEVDDASDTDEDGDESDDEDSNAAS